MATANVTKLATARISIVVDELDDELVEVQEAAQWGRKYLWGVFAGAYVWYQKAVTATTADGDPYLEETYLAQTPAIRSRAGVSEFNRLAKLAFDISEDRYSPTVSRYTAAFDYIDRIMSKRENKALKNKDIRIKKIVEIIDDKNGIYCCANEQRKWLGKQKDPRPLTDKDGNSELLDAAINKFKKQKPARKVSANPVTPTHGFVLFIARKTNKSGQYHLIDVLEDVTEEEMTALLIRNNSDG